MGRSRSSRRRFLGAIVLATLALGAVPRGQLYRCRMMGTLVGAPCCPAPDRKAPALHAECYERLPAPPQVLPDQPPPLEGRLAAPPVAAVYRLPPPPAVEAPRSSAARVAVARGSPPELRLRVPTTVLRT